MIECQNFIDGRWRPATSGATLPMIEPATGRAYGAIADSGAEDVDLAVQAARRAYEDGDWGRTTAAERGRLLSRFADRIGGAAAELAAIESRDTGKPKSVAEADIAALARYFEFYGGAADKLHGETIPYLAGYLVSVLREPHGVTGHILPWNYPAQMFGRSMAASLAVGNATVLKPAEDACASSLWLAQAATDVGFPDGAINVVTGRGVTAGAALASHLGVDFVSFTGSPEVGRLIQKLCADHYIPCTLELGGKSPQLIFADADLDAAAPMVLRAITQNSGQTCSAGSRVLIERSLYDAFAERLAERFAQVRMGPPELDLECGPIITGKQQQRVQSFIDAARSQGVPVLAQGRRDARTAAEGFYVTPTLFGPTPRASDIGRQEVFGPVLTLFPFEDEADAVALANSTDYGLTAGVWTRDGARQMRVARRIRAGQVFINSYGAGAGIELPFGGSGKSGHGREKGFAAMHDFSKTKTVVLNHG